MHSEPHASCCRSFLATVELAVVFLRADGRIEHVSNHLASLVGKPVNALLGERFVEALVAEEHRERATAFFLDEVGAVSETPILIPLKSANGLQVQIRWKRGPATKERSGTLHVISGVAVMAPAQPAAAAQRYDGMLFSYLEASPEAVVIADANGSIVALSDGAQDVFRCTRASMNGVSISELMPDRFRAGHEKLVATFVRSDQLGRRMAERAEIRALRRTGEEFAAEATIARLSTPQGDLFTAIIRDLSERKAYEVALESARVRAEAAAEAKSAFLATMSHEIRTPMNAVLGMLSVLGMEQLAPAQREMVGIAIEAGQELMDILNDILDYSRIDAGQLQLELTQFEIRSVLKKIRTLHAFKADAAGIELNVDIDPGVPEHLLGDPGRLQQILHNLVSNAIKFTPKGSVSVDAHVIREGQESATLVLDVVDTGIGIGSDKLTLIFDRFTQADTSITRKFGGSGLGLSIVKGIVDRMGGQIDVQSEPGKGSHFTVRIPVQTPVRSAAPPPGQVTRPVPIAAPVRPIRVLVAESTASGAETSRRLLEQDRVAVSIAHNGEEALRLFALAQFDLVFLDVQMSPFDGESTAKALRKLEEVSGSKKAIVIATAFQLDPARRRRLEEAGFDHVLAKPPTRDDIVQLLGLVRIRLSASVA